MIIRLSAKGWPGMLAGQSDFEAVGMAEDGEAAVRLHVFPLPQRHVDGFADARFGWGGRN